MTVSWHCSKQIQAGFRGSLNMIVSAHLVYVMLFVNDYTLSEDRDAID